MKYMGSKRWMLQNGLGHLVTEQCRSANRFIDLFSGTGAVSWHAAESTKIEVLAVDLQQYSAVLAKSVIGRTRGVDPNKLQRDWIEKSKEYRRRDPLWKEVRAFELRRVSATSVRDARRLCKESTRVITRAYGGHYFSPLQAVTIDSLLRVLPSREPHRTVCLATLISSSTICSASPGHTAQPFQPTATALSFIKDAWNRDLLQVCGDVLPTICNRKANTKGDAVVEDANLFAETQLIESDLVFVDPPYSAAQYSRFYHVLETISKGECGEVSGAGRYPPPEERPSSKYSRKTQANLAIETLLNSLGNSGCSVIMTFPQYGCSNGVKGEALIELARTWFEVDTKLVPLRHSTLGGNNSYRAARMDLTELVLSMSPRC